MNAPPVWVLISQAAQAVLGRSALTPVSPYLLRPAVVLKRTEKLTPGASVPEKLIPKRHKGILPIRATFVICALLTLMGCAGADMGSDKDQNAFCEGDFSVNSEIDLTEISHCQIITGELTIELVPFNDLTGLLQLEQVGKLSLFENTHLTNLVGLGSLHTINGDLTIAYHNNLKSLQGLDALKYIAGDIHIYENTGLTNIEGLSTLAQLNGGLYIYQNPNLERLGQFPNLSSVEDLHLADLPALTTLDGLNAITEIHHRFECDFNHQLTDFTGLHQLQTVGGDFIVNFNNNLASLNGLDALGEIGGRFVINNNGSLQSLHGQSVRTIHGRTEIRSNYQLKNLQGLEFLSSIGGDFWVLINDQLESLTGIDNLMQVAGGVHVMGNLVLGDISALQAEVLGEVVVEDNPELNSF